MDLTIWKRAEEYFNKWNLRHDRCVTGLVNGLNLVRSEHEMILFLFTAFIHILFLSLRIIMGRSHSCFGLWRGEAVLITQSIPV